MDNIEADAVAPLTFTEFCRAIYEFVDRHKVIVFVGIPLIFDCIWFPIVFSIYGYPEKEKDLWGGIIFPFAIFLGAYLCFFTRPMRHPASGNEDLFRLVLLIILVPLFGCAYCIYRIVRALKDTCTSKPQNVHSDSNSSSLQDRVGRLNELLSSGLITKADYDEQLSRLIASKA